MSGKNGSLTFFFPSLTLLSFFWTEHWFFFFFFLTGSFYTHTCPHSIYIHFQVLLKNFWQYDSTRVIFLRATHLWNWVAPVHFEQSRLILSPLHAPPFTTDSCVVPAWTLVAFDFVLSALHYSGFKLSFIDLNLQSLDVLWSCPLKMTFKKLGFWPLNQQESLVKSVLSQPWQKDTILDLLCLQLFLCCWLSFDC